MTVTLELELPEGLELDERELKWHLVAKLFDRGLVSQRKAAKMLGVPLAEFVLGVGKYEVSIFQITPEELEEEVRRMRERRAEHVG